MATKTGRGDLFAKKQFIAVGLMSGTSMDGVDAALIEIDAQPDSPAVRLIAFVSLNYPDELREALEDLAFGHETTAEEVATVNTGVGVTFAGSFFEVCRRANVDPSQVDFVGSHGQTVAHVPPEVNSGSPIAGTLQLGPPSVVAALTGVTTVGDFRTADIAVGGQGAPLTPYVDYLLRRSDGSSRVILNIGGIANLTYLPRACGPDEVIAFDTGPGNMIIDALFQVMYPGEGKYDPGGVRAREGRVSKKLVDEFLRLPYFEKQPPKSAGHREFGTPIAWRFKTRAEQMQLSRADTLATAVALTTQSVKRAIDDFVRTKGPVDAVYVSGGGLHNQAIFGGLEVLLGDIPCLPIDDLGIAADAKEAVDFAVLARETLMGRPNVLTSATGAARALVLGAIAWGSRE